MRSRLLLLPPAVSRRVCVCVCVQPFLLFMLCCIFCICTVESTSLNWKPWILKAIWSPTNETGLGKPPGVSAGPALHSLGIRNLLCEGVTLFWFSCTCRADENVRRRCRKKKMIIIKKKKTMSFVPVETGCNKFHFYGLDFTVSHSVGKQVFVQLTALNYNWAKAHHHEVNANKIPAKPTIGLQQRFRAHPSCWDPNWCTFVLSKNDWTN